MTPAFGGERLRGNRTQVASFASMRNPPRAVIAEIAFVGAISVAASPASRVNSAIAPNVPMLQRGFDIGQLLSEKIQKGWCAHHGHLPPLIDGAELGPQSSPRRPTMPSSLVPRQLAL